MEDPELIELRNKFLLGIVVSLIIVIPFFFFFYNRLIPKEPKIIQKIKEEDSMLILVTKDYCGKCNTYQKSLKEKEISYEIVNSDKTVNYEEILSTLDIVKEDIEVPSLIYVKEGQTVAILADIQNEEEMFTFIDHHMEG